MSFSLDLTTGSIKTIWMQSVPHPRPFLQVLRLQRIESFQSKLNAERYKLLLSDGLTYMHSVLTPKMNHLIYLKRITDLSIVKLIEYDIHIIKGKKYGFLQSVTKFTFVV